MKTLFAYTSKIVLSTGLALCLWNSSAHAAGWVTWEVSAGGNGHSYMAVPGSPGLTWNSANTLAQAQGGYLATITSAAENAFVFSLINSPLYFTVENGSGPALGGVQAPGAPSSADGWSWVTGEAWSYTNWHPTQPNDIPPGETRLNFISLISSTPDPRWNDIGATDQNIGGYIIEVPEPGSVTLIALGLLVLGRRMIRR